MVWTLLRHQSDNSLSGLSVVIPCYNENPEIVTSLYMELTASGAEVIVVDDGSNMDLNIPHLEYPANVGYGHAIKTGLSAASNEFVLMMDGDGEHTVIDAKKLYTVYKLINNCDMLVGCRWNKKESRLRWIGRKLINFTASCWARHFLVDLNSGMRIFKKSLAVGYSPILCDTFSFTTSLTMCMVTDEHKVAWFPIDTQPRAFGKSHVKLVKDGIITVFFIFWIGFALRTRKVRAWLRRIVGR